MGAMDVEVGKYVKTFSCPQCNECFRYRRHFDKHVEGHRKNDCKYCGKLFTVRTKLTAHLHDEHKIKLKVSKYCCQYCDRKFSKKASLYQHYQLHAEGRHLCLCCGMCFSELSDYSKHQEKHRYEKPYKCEICEDTFSRRQQYLLHVKGHEKYKCLTCKESFSAHFKLTEHQRKGHEIEEVEAKYACEICQRSFHLQSSLVLHQRVHKDEGSLHCADCGKDFSSKKSYARHLKSAAHGGRMEKNMRKFGVFICDICGKICSEKHALSLHVAGVHSKEQPKKCSFCDYKSTSKANLKRHVEFHSGDRKFICEFCGASFHMLSTLKEHHLYVHSEERNFQCSKCGKSFKRKCGLNRHLRDHSESRPYKCHCGQAYKRMSHLKRHQESSRGIVSQSDNLCRLRCDGSGGPAIDEGATKLSKKTSKNSGTVSNEIMVNEDHSKELPAASHVSNPPEEAQLVLSGLKGDGCISSSFVPNFHVKLNVSSPSTLPEQSDEPRLVKETQNMKCLISDENYIPQRVNITSSQCENENVLTSVCLPPQALSKVPVYCQSKGESDCVGNVYQCVKGISVDKGMPQSSHSELTQFFQGTHVSIPVIDLLQEVRPGNADETVILLCLPSLPLTASREDSQ